MTAAVSFDRSYALERKAAVAIFNLALASIFIVCLVGMYLHARRRISKISRSNDPVVYNRHAMRAFGWNKKRVREMVVAGKHVDDSHF